jgi:hypothetical protein
MSLLFPGPLGAREVLAPVPAIERVPPFAGRAQVSRSRPTLAVAMLLGASAALMTIAPQAAGAYAASSSPDVEDINVAWAVGADDTHEREFSDETHALLEEGLADASAGRLHELTLVDG